jgi:hypothetical protein
LVRRIDRGYENGELIVDTIGFVEHPYSFVDNYRAPHTKALRVVERWKMFGGGNAIEAMVISRRVRCALVGSARWQKVNRPMNESICAENNLTRHSSSSGNIRCRRRRRPTFEKSKGHSERTHREEP